jgi:condensin-2 complex subunit G2
VIQGFTDKKRERNVDETLTRLYQPILWRALKVANPVVRANAAALLSDAFPLQSDELARAEADQCVEA